MATAHARRTDPTTSHEAAAVVTPELTRIQQNVLAFARRMKPLGFTDLVMERQLQDSRSTLRSRRAELVTKGLIVDTGQRDRAPDDARSRIVWCAA